MPPKKRKPKPPSDVQQVAQDHVDETGVLRYEEDFRDPDLTTERTLPSGVRVRVRAKFCSVSGWSSAERAYAYLAIERLTAIFEEDSDRLIPIWLWQKEQPWSRARSSHRPYKPSDNALRHMLTRGSLLKNPVVLRWARMIAIKDGVHIPKQRPIRQSKGICGGKMYHFWA